MEFIETPAFVRSLQGVLKDDELRRLQMALTVCPTAGKIIPGSGGLRKLRWAVEGKGKKGGLRVIYYWVTMDDQIFLLYVYRKAVQEDISIAELKWIKDALEA